jgi:hypothetical protein
VKENTDPNDHQAYLKNMEEQEAAIMFQSQDGAEQLRVNR